MVRKIILMLLCVLLPMSAFADALLGDDTFSLLTGAAQTSDAAQIIDDAGVVPAVVETQITQVIGRIERDHEVDIVVLVTYDVPDDYSDSLYRVEKFADDFFDNGGYGMGADFSGMLYLIDLNNRVQYVSTGGVMIDYISDYREEMIFDAAEPYLLRSDWGGAALAAVNRTAGLMDEGRERGMFRYDRDTGRRISGIYNPLELHEVLLALGGGVLAAAIMVGTVSAAYGLKGGTYKYDLAANASCTLTQDDEQYLRETVTRMARPSSTGSGRGGSGGRSGGSGVHRSSAGRSHGGGGRRF